MSQVSTRFSSVVHALAPTAAPSPSTQLNEKLSQLYVLSQRSHYVFGSPLGPFYQQTRHHHLPRFVYFGPHTSEESLRLAFYAGFDQHDLRGTLALLHFVERLALHPDLGQGLNLSFFPLIDVLGTTAQPAGAARDLAGAHWGRSASPEIHLLERDARVRGYHGFVRLEVAPDQDEVSIRLRGHGHDTALAAGVELISSEDVDPWPVRWEADNAGSIPQDGPLAIVDDLPFRPFELTLRIPASWSAELHREAVTSILKRFVLRYRGHQAYGQYL